MFYLLIKKIALLYILLEKRCSAFEQSLAIKKGLKNTITTKLPLFIDSNNVVNYETYMNHNKNLEQKAIKTAPPSPNDQRYSSSDWIHIMLTLPHSSILRTILQPVVTISTWSTLVSIVHFWLKRKGNAFADVMCLNGSAHSFLVSSIGLLLVFRTNSAYQKFTEGRKVWEQILSVSRSLSRLCAVYIQDVTPTRKNLIESLIAAFPYILHHHIQPQCISLDECCSSDADKEKNFIIIYEPPLYAIETGQRGSNRLFSSKGKTIPSKTECWINRNNLPWRLLSEQSLLHCIEADNRPLWICDRLAMEVSAIPYGPNFTSRERLTFLSQIDKLSQCIGKCERISQTAVPLNYARHSLRSLTIWLLSLPFCLIQSFGLLTGPVMAVTSWLLFGVYQIGYNIEAPFQGSLRLKTLCDAVYRDVMAGARRNTAFHA